MTILSQVTGMESRKITYALALFIFSFFPSLQHQPLASSSENTPDSVTQQPILPDRHPDFSLASDPQKFDTRLSTTESPYDYQGPLESGTFFLAEHFLESYDRAVVQAAKLRSLGFRDIAVVYSDGQLFDVRAGLYIVMLTRTYPDKNVLFEMLDSLRARAQNHNYQLHTTRVVEVR